jgi:hypothetical protein
MPNKRAWESRGAHPSRSLVYIDLKGRLKMMIRECARRESWEHVEMLQAFQTDLLSLQGLKREDALQIIDGLVQQSAAVALAFDAMTIDAATLAAFMEAEELPDAMERVRGCWEGKRRDRNGARWRWSIACPADRLHRDELAGRLDDIAPAPKVPA